MLGSPALDALDRVASRAQDLLDAYRSGAVPAHGDARAEPRITTSSDPLSVALPPNAWLLTQDARGARTFERDGTLNVDDGVLRSADGRAVLGYPEGDARGAVPVPLRLPQGDRALGRCSGVRVGSDGSVAYTRSAIDPRSGDRTVERVAIGTIALARFPAGSAPTRLDATHVAAPSGVLPHLGTPGDGSFPGLATFSRELGSLDVDAGLQRLNEAYIAFEALGAAQRARGATDKATLDLVK